MQVKSKSGRVFDIPGADEEQAIREGISTDENAVEMSGEEMKTLRPVGRPKAAVTKQPVSIRLSADVLAYFKSTGRGWQTRIDKVLQDFVASHR